MAVDTSGIAVGQAQDLTPGLQNLQLAFQQGVVSANEVANVLQLGQAERDARSSQLQFANAMAPAQQALAVDQMATQLQTGPQRRELADLELRAQIADAESKLALQPKVAKLRELSAESDLGIVESVLGSQPFASPENAQSFFEATRPGEKVPEDPKVIQAKNQEAFTALQGFRRDMQRYSGKPTVETFDEIDPVTFDKRRVRVHFDGAGNEIQRDVIGITEKGEKSLTEKQSTSLQYVARLRQAEANVANIEAAGFDPSTVWNTLQQSASRRGAGVLASAQAQQYEAAKRNWISAVLRQESGAAISNSEYAGGNHQYFPQPGDAPSTVEQKRKLRELAQNTMKTAGLAGLPPAQKEQLMAEFAQPVLPETKVTTKVKIVPDDQLQRGSSDVAPAVAPEGAQPEASYPVVQSVAEARALPPTVQYFFTPDGRTKVNPNYNPAAK